MGPLHGVLGTNTDLARRVGVGLEFRVQGVAFWERERVRALAEACVSRRESRRVLYGAGARRTTTLSGVVSEAVTPQMALITASATCCRTAALRQAFGSQVILCESVSKRAWVLTGAAGMLDERHGCVAGSGE